MIQTITYDNVITIDISFELIVSLNKNAYEKWFVFLPLHGSSYDNTSCWML